MFFSWFIGLEEGLFKFLETSFFDCKADFLHECLEKVNIVVGCVAFCHVFLCAEEVVDKCAALVFANIACARRIERFLIRAIGCFGEVDLAVAGEDCAVARVLCGVA